MPTSEPSLISVGTPTDWFVRSRPGSSTKLATGRAGCSPAPSSEVALRRDRRRDLGAGAPPSAGPASSFNTMLTGFLLADWERMHPQRTSGGSSPGVAPTRARERRPVGKVLANPGAGSARRAVGGFCGDGQAPELTT